MNHEDFIKFLKGMDMEAARILKDEDFGDIPVIHPAEYLFNAFSWIHHPMGWLYWHQVWTRLERYYS